MHAKCQGLYFLVTIVIAVWAMTAIAPSARSNAIMSARLGEMFTIKVGEQAFIEAEDLTITFVSVVEDSRCPIDVRCTWEGNTRIVITLSKNKNKSASIELNTSRLFAREGRYLDYRIGLVKLDPDRTSTREIAEHEYRASLILTKA
jgi:hypothetical protein